MHALHGDIRSEILFVLWHCSSIGIKTFLIPKLSSFVEDSVVVGGFDFSRIENWLKKTCLFLESKMLGVRWSFPKPSITKNHQGNIGFLCPVCGKVLKTKPGYRLHYKINHGEKTRLPACDVCGKHFHCVSRLESHKRSHSKDRDFVCLQCGRSFKYKNNLKSHSCNLKG